MPENVIVNVKRETKGDAMRYKALLATCSYFQLAFEDRSELYTPVSCIELICLVLTFVAVYGLAISHLDVKREFYTPCFPGMNVS